MRVKMKLIVSNIVEKRFNPVDNRDSHISMLHHIFSIPTSVTSAR